MVDVGRVRCQFALLLDVARNLHKRRLDQDVRDWRVMTRLLEINAENVLVVLLLVGQFLPDGRPVGAHEGLVSLAQHWVEALAWLDNPIDGAEHCLHHELHARHRVLVLEVEMRQLRREAGEPLRDDLQITQLVEEFNREPIVDSLWLAFFEESAQTGSLRLDHLGNHALVLLDHFGD